MERERERESSQRGLMEFAFAIRRSQEGAGIFNLRSHRSVGGSVVLGRMLDTSETLNN